MGSAGLPLQLTNFIGRDRDVAAVERILSSQRLLTLTGIGGCGKTRLAIHVADRVSQEFADGVWFADLAPLREPDLAAQYLIEALNLQLVSNQPPLETLQGFFRSRQLLLVLDNCEHLNSACAALAQQLLSHAPGLQILATSREPLAIAGETIYPISGLDWPTFERGGHETGQEPVQPQELMHYDAVHLFVERTRAITPQFALTSENATAIVEICRHLDGLPLALELASARTNVLTVQEIALRLSHRLAFLISRHRTGFEPRHHTLRAAIDWSYELLAPEERTLLNRLGVFSAGCTLDTAEAICSDESITSDQILDLLSTLVRKSLVLAETTGRPQARYRLLETIREYALEKLEESGETKQIRDRHLAFYLARAEETMPKQFEAYQQLSIDWLDDEHDNLRGALSWALESGKIELGLRTASALSLFWEIRGYLREGVSWLQRLLGQADQAVSLNVHVDALVFATFHFMLLGDSQAAMKFAREAVDLAEAASDPGSPILAFARDGLASAARAAGDHQLAYKLIGQNIDLYRQEGPSFYLGMALLAQGENALQLGHYEIARERLTESLALARAEGDKFRTAHSLNTLGDLSRLERKYDEAVETYSRGLELMRELDAQRDLASLASNLGFVTLHLGDIERAYHLFSESVGIHQAQQNRPGMIECLVGFAAMAVKSGRPASGVRLFAAAAAISQRPSISVWKATQMESETYLDLARSKLADGDFQAAQTAGRALSLEQALEFAGQLQILPEPTRQAGREVDELTPREHEVVGLIAQGKTNGEIAEELVLSKRTVEKHVGNILSKLDFTSRTQIARWAIEEGLSQLSE